MSHFERELGLFMRLNTTRPDGHLESQLVNEQEMSKSIFLTRLPASVVGMLRTRDRGGIGTVV